MGSRAYLVLLLAVAAERCAELWLSRRNYNRALRRGGVEIGGPHYRVMVLIHVLFLGSCAIENAFHPAPVPLAVTALALAGAALAQILRYWAVFTLGERWNTRIVVMPGEEPVTQGPYRYLRHPNYLAVIIEFVCIPMIRGLWVTALVFSIANALILSVRIPSEERAMGRQYAAAFASHSRLIPKLPLDWR
jgi:methyltransferase